MEFYKNLGLKIKEKRNELGISQLDLSKSLGHSSAAYIAFIESGKRRISVEHLYKLSNILAVTVQELLGLNPIESPCTLWALKNDDKLTLESKMKVIEYYKMIKYTQVINFETSEIRGTETHPTQ